MQLKHVNDHHWGILSYCGGPHNSSISIGYFLESPGTSLWGQSLKYHVVSALVVQYHVVSVLVVQYHVVSALVVQ